MCETNKRDTAPLTPPPKKKYQSQMYYPFGIEKYILTRIWLSQAHIFGIIGYIFLFAGIVPRSIFLIVYIYGYFAGLGSTMGAHRLWSHKTYKAKLPLRIILAFAQTATVSYPIFQWCRDHRLHHKFVETDADPHDPRRGFFFAHIGWLLTKEHPAVKEKEETLDFSDLDNDPVVRAQSKYYWFIWPIALQLVPGSIMHYFYPEVSIFQLFCLNFVWYLNSLHFALLVNSVAHFYGYRPYDKSHGASENLFISFLAVGEGQHNYHHAFPYDYKSAEIGHYGTNWTCLFIDLFAKIGWAYDLKSAPKELITKRILRTGDQQVHISKYGDAERFKIESEREEREVQTEQESQLPTWGWGDKDIPEEHLKILEVSRWSKDA